MAHLTMGELAPALAPAASPLRNTFSQGMARLARIRKIPGYNRAVLDKYGAALPLDVLAAENLRLQKLKGDALAPDPVASALTALSNAYRNRDQFDIERWENAITMLGAKRYLARVRAAARKDSAIGYTTAGFWNKYPTVNGMSGMG